MESICTAEEFKGRKDPYTGNPLTVKLYVLPGGDVRYRIEGGHDVAEPKGTMEEAVAAWTAKDGVSGMRDPADGFVCAYTGAKLRPVPESGACRFAGGFSPGLFHTRDEVLAAFAFLDGKPVQATTARVEAVHDAPPAPRYGGHEPSDDAFERAESLVGTAKRTLGVSPAAPVSMHVRGRRRRR